MTKNKLFVPAITFLTGIVVWFIFFFWYNADGELRDLSLWINILFSFFIAGVFTFSARSCRTATGGRTGNSVRSVVLLILAVFTFFRVGIHASGILAVAAVMIGVMALRGTDFAEDPKEPALKS